MRSLFVSYVVPATLVLSLSALALADTVTLANGHKLEGSARRVGDRVVIQTAGGEVTLEASEVRSIEKGETKLDLYQAKRETLDAKDAKAQAELARWCAKNKLGKQSREHWEEVVKLDPEHADARTALGFVQHDGAWMTPDEAKEAQGLVKVKVGGRERWVPRAEARAMERKDAERDRKKALQKHVRTIRRSIALMGSHKRKTRLSGRVMLQEYGESIGDMELAAMAGKIADHYNTQWRIYKTSLAKTEIRATHSQLKRPIDRFQTSLGANTTPVSIQLPELSVVQIKTTVLIPASEVELDEDG